MSGWTGLQLRTLILCFVLNMLDGADVLVVSFVAPVLTREWHISDAVFGLVFSSGLAGMTLGALLLAPYADLWGRKTLILFATGVIASGMLASAMADNVYQLVALRFWTGLGIGSMLASVATLASEFAPERYRPFAVITATAGYPIGATLAGLIGGAIIPAFGWQGMFVFVGAGSLLMLPLLHLALPESVQFLVARQPRHALLRANRYLAAQGLALLDALPPRTSLSSRPPIGSLLRRDLRSGTFLIWGAFFSAFLTLYFLTSWVPRIALEAGYPLATAINGSAIFNLGAFVGLITLGWLAPRIGLAKLVGLFFVLAMLAMLVFGEWHAPTSVFYADMFLIGFLLQGGFGGLYGMVARFYPTEMKTTGVGWAIGVGRLGAVAGPILGGMAISGGLGLQVTFALFALPVIVAAGFVWLLARG